MKEKTSTGIFEQFSWKNRGAKSRILWRRGGAEDTILTSVQFLGLKTWQIFPFFTIATVLYKHLNM